MARLVVTPKDIMTGTQTGTTAQPSTFETNARAHLALLQSRTSPEEIYRATGLKTGDFDWDGYVEELRGVYRDLFQSSWSNTHDGNGRQKKAGRNDGGDDIPVIQQLRTRLADSFDLSQHRHQVKQSIPHVIYTTSKEQSLPKEFSSWNDSNSRDGWQVESYDDDDIWKWMIKVFGQEKQTGQVKNGSQVMDVYQQISNSGLRGVFTDTDTACIQPLIRWPGTRGHHLDVKDITDPKLNCRIHMADLGNIARDYSTKLPLQGNGQQSPHGKITALGAIRNRLAELKVDAWEPPKLVVGIEFDDWGPGAKEHWTGVAGGRGMQVAQSTILAQPGHPVFLDVLGRIVKEIENSRKHRDGLEMEETDTHLIGPGLFSDAVFRYLLARWGVHPKDLTRADGTRRIGDVLIYPLNGFTSVHNDGSRGQDRPVSRSSRGKALLSDIPASRTNRSDRDLRVSPDTIEALSRARLELLQSRYSEHEVEREIGLKIGKVGWIEYMDELQELYKHFFQLPDPSPGNNSHFRMTKDGTPGSSSLVQDIWESLADSLQPSLLGNTPGYGSSIPHIIHTTAKEPKFAEQFSSWRELNAKDGWSIKYYNDDGIWRWIKAARILKEYEELPTGVHKDKAQYAESMSGKDVHNRMAELEAFQPPKLVVAIEFDSWGPGRRHWEEVGFSRGIQITQWTMMAQSGHPVFLDTIGRIMKEAERRRDPHRGSQGSDQKGKLLDVLDFTGPGVFSDAVFRYLLARWGVHPRDISRFSGPQRFGDVLSFGSWKPKA
ncbi:hypothetical protein QFC21_005521 [Naganishia friedmannii]|uniref:Uncharacterized protein n=1 Tax=Naganishia friedmannii TaxID=89922 RepID=A0ACC2V8F8_9TREE|nr:hypothetical protein QFC21_005521 [Naganishia friedmannii]